MLRYFPPARAAWHQKFESFLLAWAGAQEDVFGIDKCVALDAAYIWECAYPDSMLQNDDYSALVIMVSPLHQPRTRQFLTDHTLGARCLKEMAISFGDSWLPCSLGTFLLNPELGFEDCQGYISDAINEMCYIYKHPDDEVRAI
jgi:hypothetical protein